MAADGRNNFVGAGWTLAWVMTIALLACGEQQSANTIADTSANRAQSSDGAPPAPREEEPAQWTLREVARRLTDGGLVVTDSGRASVTHFFLSVEGHQLKVSGSDLQVFIYPDPRARTADSDRIGAEHENILGNLGPKPNLIASGNLLAIHLTPNERLAERVRLILEAWHAAP